MTTLSGLNTSQLANQGFVSNSGIGSFAKLITLVSRFTSANPYGVFRKVGVQTGYLIPASKKFLCIGGVFTQSNTLSTIELGWCDNDVGFSSATPGTNSTLHKLDLFNTTANAVKESAFLLPFPAQKYIEAANVGGSGQADLSIFGFELDVSAASI